MLTVLCVRVATVPFAVVFGLLGWMNRLDRSRREIQARQIALTDGIHERLGAAVAPVVSHRRGGWQVWIAVPFERPAEPPATKRDGDGAVSLESLSWT